ncbi:hypothetical protein PMSD_12645 [Paenibacillus macquariensis subsp. defensor]|nr:hypothetical protein PMSD_12645 [Paenibacillus macquariensis subsp. defensor]
MDTITLKTLADIRIYSDPYRMDIMNEFQKLDRPATVKEIADIMGEVPAKVYYHAKKLISIGLLTLDHTEQINGITAKYYQAFQGIIAVKRSEIDAPIENVLSETQKLLVDIYDKSKQKFISLMDINIPFGNISNRSIYLTKEEADQFHVMINEYCDKHQKQHPHLEQAKYEIFASIIKESSDEMNKPS